MQPGQQLLTSNSTKACCPSHRLEHRLRLGLREEEQAELLVGAGLCRKLAGGATAGSAGSHSTACARIVQQASNCCCKRVEKPTGSSRLQIRQGEGKQWATRQWPRRTSPATSTNSFLLLTTTQTGTASSRALISSGLKASSSRGWARRRTAAAAPPTCALTDCEQAAAAAAVSGGRAGPGASAAAVARHQPASTRHKHAGGSAEGSPQTGASGRKVAAACARPGTGRPPGQPHPARCAADWCAGRPGCAAAGRPRPPASREWLPGCWGVPGDAIAAEMQP